jgi:hypothetical protein
MKLYRHHIGKHAIDVGETPDGLDVVASRDERKVYLHVVNTKRERSVSARLHLADASASKATCYEIAEDPMAEVSELNSAKFMQTKTRDLPLDGSWEFPAASVSAVEVELAA